MHRKADYSSWFRLKMPSSSKSWAWLSSDHILTPNKLLQSLFKTMLTHVWSTLGVHQSAITASLPKQTTPWTKTNLWCDSTKLNATSVKPPSWLVSAIKQSLSTACTHKPWLNYQKQTEKRGFGENIFMFCQLLNWLVHPCPLSATTAAETAAENWSGSAGGSDRMSNPVWYRASTLVTVMMTGYVTGRGRKHSFRCVICTETLCTLKTNL